MSGAPRRADEAKSAQVWVPGKPLSLGHRDAFDAEPLREALRQQRAPASVALPAAAAARTTTPTSAAAAAASMESKAAGKHRPTETIKVNLLALAMAHQSKRDKQLKAREEASKRGRPSKEPARAANPNQLDSTADRLVLAGKQRARGKKDKKKSRLKRAVLAERRAVWWLNNADAMPSALLSHPSLAGFDCMWWPGAVPAEEEEKEPVVPPSSPPSPPSSPSDRDGDDEAPASSAVDDPAGSFGFDAAVVSPVFFGATCALSPSRPLAAAAAAATSTPLPHIAAARTRSYVEQSLSKDLDDLVCAALAALYKFQERVRLEEPARARLKRRLHIGLREVAHGVKARQCVCVILAPNVEGAGALDDAVGEILARCRANDVPVVFACTKRVLGRALGKTVGVSAVGVHSAEGAHEPVALIIAAAARLRATYRAVVDAERAAKKPVRCAVCAHAITGLVRVDCTGCRAVACEACALPLGCGGEEGKTHALARTTRVPPVFALSAGAAAFVPRPLPAGDQPT